MAYAVSDHHLPLARAQRELDSLEFHGRLSPGQERVEAVGSRSAKGLVARGDLDQAWWQTGQQVGFDARTVNTLQALEQEMPDRALLARRITERLTEFHATFTPTHGRATALESAAGLGDELYSELRESGIVLDLADGRQTTSFHRAMERKTVAAASSSPASERSPLRST